MVNQLAVLADFPLFEEKYNSGTLFTHDRLPRLVRSVHEDSTRECFPNIMLTAIRDAVNWAHDNTSDRTIDALGKHLGRQCAPCCC